MTLPLDKVRQSTSLNLEDGVALHEGRFDLNSLMELSNTGISQVLWTSFYTGCGDGIPVCYFR